MEVSKMAWVNVNLEDMAGKRFRAQLPDDAPVSSLLRQLLTKLNLSLTDSSGHRLSYRLFHIESGIQLRDSDTLVQCQVQDGHTLRLIADLVAGRKRFVAKTETIAALWILYGKVLRK